MAANIRQPEQLAGYIIGHYRAMLDHYGGRSGVRHARKHLGWYLDVHAGHLPDIALRKGALLRETNPQIVQSMLAEMFATANRRTTDALAA